MLEPTRGPAPRAIPHSYGEVICLPEVQRLWLPIRKNAHTAVFEAIWSARVPWYPVRPADLPRHHMQRICLWRDPFDRLESAYRYFHDKDLDWPDLPDAKQPFADWVLAICRMPDSLRNPHIRSQYAIAKLFFTTLPEIIIRWDFAELATNLGVPEIPKLNASTEMELVWTEEAMAKAAWEYAIDFKVWEQ